MPRMIRNSFGEALERATGSILEAHIMNRRLGQQDRALDLQEESNLISARHADVAEKQNAWNTFLTAAEMLPPGESIAQHPWISAVAEQAGIDTAHPMFQEINPNPETVQSFMESTFRSALQSGVYDADSLRAMSERYVTGQAFGTPMSFDQLAIQGIADDVQLQAVGDMYRTMDQRTRDRIAETMFGLEPSVRFNFGGREYEFESSDAGRIALGFAQIASQESIASANRNDEMLRFREQFIRDATLFGREQFGVGDNRARVEVSRVMGGHYSDPNSPDGINWDRVNSISDEKVQDFVKFQLSAREEGLGTIFDQIAGTPTGDAIINTMQVLDGFSSFLPKETVDELAAPLLRELSEQTGLPFADIRRAGMIRRANVGLPGVEPNPRGGQMVVPGGEAQGQQGQQAGMHPDQVRDFMLQQYPDQAEVINRAHANAMREMQGSGGNGAAEPAAQRQRPDRVTEIVQGGRIRTVSTGRGLSGYSAPGELRTERQAVEAALRQLQGQRGQEAQARLAGVQRYLGDIDRALEHHERVRRQ
jgi:hypothetical protein